MPHLDLNFVQGHLFYQILSVRSLLVCSPTQNPRIFIFKNTGHDYGTFKFLPIMLSNVPGECVRHTQHNGQGVRRFHDIKVWGGSFQQFLKKFNREICYYYECMIVMGRFCHIMWSRKWHYLSPQTFNVYIACYVVCDIHNIACYEYQRCPDILLVSH